jgi:hypothetical protein
MIAITLALITVLAATAAFAGGPPAKSSTLSKVYAGTTKAANTAEDLFSGCLKTVFGMCNPCLDVVKNCSSRVMAPVDYPFTLLERYRGKPQRKACAKPPTAKPEAQSDQAAQPSEKE